MEPIVWEAILAASVFFILGATSPGPSLIVVLRNTLIGGRRQGVACAVGHGIGFGIYAGSAVFGLILLLDKSPNTFLILQMIGVGLLVFYGVKMWNAEVEECKKSAPMLENINARDSVKVLQSHFSIPKLLYFWLQS